MIGLICDAFFEDFAKKPLNDEWPWKHLWRQVAIYSMSIGREGIIMYERTSHPSNIKNVTPFNLGLWLIRLK
jgi:hypothetical protein